jgi:G:T/U-mismatch repair DNA glycosylase
VFKCCNPSTKPTPLFQPPFSDIPKTAMTDDFMTDNQDQVTHTDLTSAAEMLAKLTATPADKPQTPSAAESDEKPSKTRRAYRKPVIVDLNLLKAVAEQIGIKGKNRSSEDLLHQVLEIFLVLGFDTSEPTEETSELARPAAESIHSSVAQPVESAGTTAAQPLPAAADLEAVDLKIVADQAKTLAWFTGEIETLKTQVQQLEQALHQKQIQPTDQVAALRQENERLQRERDAAVEKLETFRKLLNGSSTPTISEGLTTERPAVPSAPVTQPEATPATATPATSKKASSRVSSTRAKKAIAPPAAKSTATKPAAAKSKPVSASEDASLDPGVLKALYAIMDYNNAQSTHADKWAISFPVMKDLCKTIGVATQTKITQVFRAKEDLIEQHHQEHSLGQRHNRVHQGQSITDVISLDA